jgi:hypothetical protein
MLLKKKTKKKTNFVDSRVKKEQNGALLGP